MLGMNLPIHLFPFHEVHKGSRIVVWGMGQIGKCYLRQILGLNYCDIVYAVDKSLSGRDLAVRAYEPGYIQTHRDFDYIVIAIGNRGIADDIKKTLLGWGIDKKKIVHEKVSFCESIRISDMDLHLPDVSYLKEIKKLLKVYTVYGIPFVRCGARHDGGYVMLDDFHRGGIAYSFGINNDVSWDDDVADKGYDIFMYDHTVTELPKPRKEFHFFRKGIADDNVTEELDTLEAFVKRNNHTNCKNMILKMDVEGAEWGFLEKTSSELLKMFSQIVMEIHGIFSESLKYKIIAGLNKLNSTHGVVHVHANNYGRVYECKELCIGDTLEVTWANKMIYEMEEVEAVLPILLDSPNCQAAPEIVLGNWNKV